MEWNGMAGTNRARSTTTAETFDQLRVVLRLLPTIVPDGDNSLSNDLLRTGGTKSKLVSKRVENYTSATSGIAVLLEVTSQGSISGIPGLPTAPNRPRTIGVEGWNLWNMAGKSNLLHYCLLPSKCTEGLQQSYITICKYAGNCETRRCGSCPLSRHVPSTSRQVFV